MVGGILPTRQYIRVEDTAHPVIALDLWLIRYSGHYRLDERQIIARQPAGTNNILFSKNILTGSETHTATCSVNTGGLSPQRQSSRSAKFITHLHVIPKIGTRGSILSLPYTPSWPAQEL